MLSDLLWFGAGLIALMAGAELLVRGASSLAKAWGVAPLVIGLTVVAYGTSTPELAVSLKATLAGQPDISVGNVVGSNIANVLLILGLCASIAPLQVALQLVRSEVWIMVAVSVVLWAMSIDGALGRWDGLLLTTGLVIYTWQSVRQEPGEARSAEEGSNKGLAASVSWKDHWSAHVTYVVAGFALLVTGSDWLIEASMAIGRKFGISELILGLTVVAVGTSLPELATSFVATLRGERDIAVGNIVGSNIFNIVGVLGLSSALSPVPINIADSAFRFDIPVMTAVAVACLPIFFTGYRIDRWEGGLFLGYYVAYLTYLAFDASSPQAYRLFKAGMLGFVIPLTVITLAVITARAWRRRT